jgi:hypothetical protein
MMLASFATSPSVYAIDVLFQSSNTLGKYNAEDGGAKCTTQSAPTQTVPGGNNEEIAWNYMIAKGLTPQQVAGMVGNWQVESPGVNPTTNQTGGGPGRGIAQWSVSERWAELLKWKGDRNEFDLVTQLDFVWYELNGSEKSAFTAFKATKTIKEATTVFMEKYERPGVPHLDDRIAAANLAYGRYSGNVSAPPSLPSASVNSVNPAPSSTCGTSGGSASGGTVVEIALAELAKGVKENPLGCDAGNPSSVGSCGAEVDKYTDKHLEYWCADFTSWVYKQAGTPFTGGSSGGWRIAAVSGIEAWFKENGTWTPNGPSANPQPGDVYTLDISHVGIVEKVEGNTLYVISGNTSTDNTGNGNGVGRDVVNNYKSYSNITGFGSLGK